MAKQDLAQKMYGLTGPSLPQRITLAALLAACAVLAWSLLWGGGLTAAGAWFGAAWHPGDALRRATLATAFTIGFLRVLIAVFVFLSRGVSWTEVFTVAPWVLFIYLLLGISGGLNPSPFGPAAVAGAALFLLGSWMNSWAEYRRHVWKQDPENAGKLYTLGLFRLCRHPNYLGDLLSFSGLSLLTGRWFTGIVPLLMLCGFVFVNIPVLDTHLARHYGAAFDRYARSTRKLIPFLY